MHLCFVLLGLWAASTSALSHEPHFQLQRAFPALDFERPVFLTHSGSDGDRIFVVEQQGRIFVFPNRDDVEEAELFLDIRPRVSDGPNEAGLLSVAFHPAYADNGRLFICYTAGNLVSRISELRVSSNPNRADADSERLLLEIDQPAANHNGGQIAFGPDGFLYIGFGDGGASNDRFHNGQDPTTLLGAILRIDIDGPHSVGLEYGIPADNPFVSNDDGWREEIWAYGLRNPWRFSFDRATGELWTGDVGQGSWEEINIIRRGGNYGWNVTEGFHCFRSSSCDAQGLAEPVLEYDRGAGKSITGGYVYRGRRKPSLFGAYLYADFITRNVWALHYDGRQVTENKLLTRAPAGVSSFGEDEAGEVYLLAFDGGIYGFEPDPPQLETAVHLESGPPPQGFKLLQNFPNPSNPETSIPFVLPASTAVRLELFDVLGRRILTLVDGPIGAGTHQFRLDTSALPSSVYFYRLHADGQIFTRKMVVVG
ncbi:MAG: PQQ-dependent sugar dehydrogenase [Candidatus Latescibacterota bacterium]|nr:PQQ-dependent sugar dehydrogenase [Candidatus Latescibacterota bacterium]